MAQLCFAAMNVFTRLGVAPSPLARDRRGRASSIGAADRGRRSPGRAASRCGSPTGAAPGGGASTAPWPPSALLLALLARRRAWATPRRSAPPRRSSSPCSRGRCWASGSAAGSGSRSPWRSRASCCWCDRRSPSPRPVAAVATAGAFFYALAMIWLRRIGPGESHEAVVLHFSLVALATMLVLAVPSWTLARREGRALPARRRPGGGGAQLAMTRAYSLIAPRR